MVVKEREESKELTKEMFLEVQRIFRSELEIFKAELKVMFMSKDDCSEAHKERNSMYEGLRKIVLVFSGISLVAICISMVAMGMRLEDAILKMLGVLK